jgi:hypothetical protein
MAKLNFNRRHGLTIDDAKTKITGLVDDFKADYAKFLDGVAWAPDGRSAKAKGTGFVANFSVDASQVSIDIDLSLPASLIKSKIETRVGERLDRVFGPSK